MDTLTKQRKAYSQVRTAIKNGILRRAQFCSRCGTPDRKCSDGRSLIQAHHLAGYDEPLLVEWLCSACHREDTPLPSHTPPKMPGSMNGCAKLDEEKVKEILASNLSSRQLGKAYGVAYSVISRIKRGEAWQHVTAASTLGEQSE